MRPGPWNTTIQRGASFKPVITINYRGEPVDLTGCVAAARGFLRDWEGEELFYWRSDDDPAYITVGTTDGKITFHVPEEVTADLEHCRGKWYFQVWWSDGQSDRLTTGTLDVSEAY